MNASVNAMNAAAATANGAANVSQEADETEAPVNGTEQLSEIPTDPDAMMRLADLVRSVRERGGEVIADIRADVQALNVSKDTAKQVRDADTENSGKLYKDILRLVPMVAEATASREMRPFAHMLFNMLLADVVKGNPVATVKAYLSLGRNMVTRVYHDRMIRGENIEAITADVETKNFTEARAMINPPKDPSADKMAKACMDAIRFIKAQANNFGEEFHMNGEDGKPDPTLTTNAQNRLAAIYAFITPHYNAVKRAKDAATAKSEAAKAGATMADGRRENEAEGSTVETVAKPEAQPQRAVH